MVSEPWKSSHTGAGLTQAEVELANALRRLRRERGLSMREMVRPLSLAAHSAVADYESGRRVPARDILNAYERYFDLAPGTLLTARQKALSERAAREARRATEASRPDSGW